MNVGGLVFEDLAAEEIPDGRTASFGRVLRGAGRGGAARRTLYLIEESYILKKGNRETAAMLKQAGIGRDARIAADSAEPKKGPGGVEYSMKRLQSLARIVIDPKRRPAGRREFTTHEYERTKTGEFLGGYPDGNNHHIDAARYAAEPVWKRRGQ